MDANYELKIQAIKEFLKYLHRLNVGYQDDYLNINDIILFLEVSCKLDNATSIYQRLIK